MSKVIRNAEEQLNSFFKKANIEKIAGIGHFSDVTSEEDMEKYGSMVYEMVQLPKYKELINQLKAASGVINFVTNNEYEPLTEFLLKTAFPPSNNQVFNMGQETMTPEDYFVDAAELFPGKGDKAVIAAQANLGTVLNGYPQKMTKKWMADNGIEASMLHEIFDTNKDPETDMSELDHVLAEQIGYEEQMQELNHGTRRKDINLLYKKIDTNRKNAAKNKQIEKENEERPLNEHQNLMPLLPASKIEKLKSKLSVQKALWLRHKKAVMGGYQNINVPEEFSGRSVRDNSGFAQWNPISDVNSVMQLIDETPKTKTNLDKIGNLFSRLSQEIESYRTTDPALNKQKEQILSFLNDTQAYNSTSNPMAYKWINNRGQFDRAMTAFTNGANQQGKVILMTGVESSALTSMPSEDGTQTVMDNGLLNNFNASNNANLLRDRSSAQKRGGRKMVIISSSPLSGMTGATTIELDVSPVDEAEAEIIIRHISQGYVSEASNAVRLKMMSGLEGKYDGVLTPEQKQERSIELAGLKKSLSGMKESLGSMSPETKKQLAQLIQGMGQKTAIKVTESTIESNAEREYDEEGMLASLTIDDKSTVKQMVSNMSKEKSASVLGLHLQTPTVEFGSYITKKDTLWSNQVGTLAQSSREIEYARNDADTCRSYISDIDFQLADTSLSPSDRTALEADRESWKQLGEDALKVSMSAVKDFPHFVILHGEAGTGKSVWGDAMADLLGLMYYTVNVEEIKDKWVGGTEKQARALVSAIFNSNNTVYLMDEIDKMLEMSSATGGTKDAGHATDKAVVKIMLDEFENRKEVLIEKNIFVVMTTNFIDAINDALKSRSDGAWEVEASDDPEDFYKFLDTFVETERKRLPNNPWIKDMEAGGRSDSEMWDYTQEYINTNIDKMAIATACAQKKLPFRDMGKMLRRACVSHNSYLRNKKAIADGHNVQQYGFPLTTDNLMGIVGFADSGVGTQNQKTDGSNEYGAQMNKQVREAMKGVVLEEYTEIHPITGKEETKYKLPDEISELLKGDSAETEAPQNIQFETTQKEGPGGTMQSYLTPTTPIDDLVDQGMQEQDFGLDQEKTAPVEEKDEDSEKVSLASNSDYLFGYLKEAGLIDDVGKFRTAQNVENDVANLETPEGTQNFVPRKMKFGPSMEELEQQGVYYYNDNDIIVAPAKYF